MPKLFLFFTLLVCRQLPIFAQFAPPAGQIGSTAIYKDSSIFVTWANNCHITRGYQNIAEPNLGLTTVGDSTAALGKAGENGVVSLGDAGIAVLTFPYPITNGNGWDFAVFENSFDDQFLEFAFVEVSSDGIHFVRFPATSNSQDSTQTGTFGYTDATKINNLAGKYRVFYGTPFDLNELKDSSSIDINHVTHVKIIDVIGCIQSSFASYDTNGRKINEPWATPFPSGGFDLDAVGVIHQLSTFAGDKDCCAESIKIFPNPASNFLNIEYDFGKNEITKCEIFDVLGNIILSQILVENTINPRQLQLDISSFSSGFYWIRLESGFQFYTQKIIIQHE